MHQTLRLSIIIVSYNTKTLIQQFLGNLFAVEFPNEWEVIIIDNASTDGSVEEVEEVKWNVQSDTLKLIKNKKNVGFSAANNQGLKIAKGEYVLLLNSDTIASPAAIHRVLSYFDKHEDVGVATCKLILGDGQIDPASHRGFPTPWAAFTYFAGLEKLFPTSQLFSQYHQWYKDVSQTHEIDSPSGAFFMVRRRVIDEIGFLDESYFMYGEDLDWAYRIKKAGWKIVFIPDVVVTHLKKQSGRDSTDPDKQLVTRKHFFQTMLQFYDKHYSNQYPFFISLLVHVSLKFRLIILEIFKV